MKNNYKIKGDITEIYTDCGNIILIDTKNFELVSKAFKWKINNNQVRGQVNKQTKYLGSYILNTKNKITYINKNPLDNRECNIIEKINRYLQNEYKIDGNITFIYFGYKKDDKDFTLKIDTKNLTKLDKCSYIRLVKNKKGDYIQCRFRDKREIKISHLIKPIKIKGNYIDHIDRDIFNNLEANLREITSVNSAQNRNGHKDAKIPYRGVTYNKNNGKYDLRITIKGKTKWWRNFKTAEEANKFGIKMRKKLMPFSYEGGN